VIDGLSFVGKLQATTTHAKVHRVHMDKTCVRLVLRLEVRKFVDVERHFNVHFFLSSFSNRLGKAQKAWVGACNDLGDHARECGFINDGETFCLLGLV
jgi:hypothetical protein